MKVSLWAYLREQRHCVFVRGALLYPVWTNLLNFKTSGKDGSSSSTRRELEEEEEGGVGAEEGTEGTEEEEKVELIREARLFFLIPLRLV